MSKVVDFLNEHNIPNASRIAAQVVKVMENMIKEGFNYSGGDSLSLPSKEINDISDRATKDQDTLSR